MLLTLRLGGAPALQWLVEDNHRERASAGVAAITNGRRCSLGSSRRAMVPSNKGMKQTSVEHIGRSQLIPGVRRTSQASTAKGWSMSDPAKPRLGLLAVLCAPGLATGAVLALDTLTSRFLGSALTTWGFLGGLVGLAAFFLGFVSILVWPAVLVMTWRVLRLSSVSGLARSVAGLACLGATYTAVYFIVWFVVLPLTALW